MEFGSLGQYFPVLHHSNIPLLLFALFSLSERGYDMGLEKRHKDLVLGNLLPRPERIEPVSEDFPVSETTRLVIFGSADPAAVFAAERLVSMIEEEFNLRLPIVQHEPTGPPRFFLVDRLSDLPKDSSSLRTLEQFGSEGYALYVDSRSTQVDASTPKGLFYGAMTLRQLLTRQDDRLWVAGVRITDKPRYQWRGFMFDSGRAPNSVAKMKRIIRICSSFKLNFVIFREGDDELNAVRYRTNPLGAENPHALSVEEVQELIDYAGRYGVTVVPEVESLGHSTAKGFHDPTLVAGGFLELYEGLNSHTRKSHLLPGDPRSYALLESIYREWIPLLKSPFIHLGLDEVRLDVEAQSRHLEGLLHVIDRVANHYGKTITSIVWGDAPAIPAEFRDRVIRCPWSYHSHGEIDLANPHLQNQAVESLVREGCPEKVLMAGGSDSWHTPYTKSDYEPALRNLACWANLGKDHPNFIGLIAVQWSGNMTDDWLPDFLAAGDYGWNPPGQIPTFSDEMACIRYQLARIHDATHPDPVEVDRPAWDGIWLNGREWDQDIRTGQRSKMVVTG